MKLQSLAIIFIIIIMPLTMVINTYIDNRIECAELELDYDTRLLNATYDAVKAYQLNTVNNAFGNVANEKVSDIEAAVETLKNSLVTSFNYSGYQASVIDEYIPAVVFTTYDGYYVYSTFYNTLTNLGDDDYDDSYSENGEETTGLKPYVTYSCEYDLKDGKNDFIITYTLDNYITIEGMLNGTYHYDYGYLYNVGSSTNYSISLSTYENNGQEEISYIYDGVYYSLDYKYNAPEEMGEYVGDEYYSYIKINGTKYYLDEYYYDLNGDGVSNSDDSMTVNVDIKHTNIYDSGNYNYTTSCTIDVSAGIFYIDSTGEKNYEQAQYDMSKDADDEENQKFIKYYYLIKNNNSAYEYLKNAYEFSRAVLNTPLDDYTDKAGNPVGKDYDVLKTLTWGNAVIWDESADDTTSLQEYAGAAGGDTKIFSSDAYDSTNPNKTQAIQLSTSNFNEHRKAIIRYTIETNLVSAIASFSSSKASSFVMPKISEDDWDIIENDVCAISFMQGMSIGTKQYNGYAVVANTLTNDYVDENDIYILAYDDSTDNYVYCKPNDGTISGYGSSSVHILTKAEIRSLTDHSLTGRSYYSGIWKLNFETKQDVSTGTTIYYIPMSYVSTNATTRRNKVTLILWKLYKYIWLL